MVNLLLPPDKRGNIMVAWLTALVSPIQWLRDLIFDSYVAGTSYPDWNNTTAYPYGARLRYIDGSVYECIQATTAGILPTDTNYWYKVLNTWIGLNERMKYTAQKIMFEYALNKYFRVLPTDPNQIYITNNVIKSPTFVLGQTALTSSSLAQTTLYEATFLSQTFIAGAQYSFTIFVPIAVYNALASNDGNRQAIIRGFADTINTYGILYNIQSY